MSHSENIGDAAVARETKALPEYRFPLTATQLRCWFLDQLRPGDPALNVAVKWEIRGALRATTVEAAFRRIIQRHEILRTRLVECDGEPCQEVMPSVDFVLDVVDLTKVAEQERERRVDEIALATADAPFDLGEPPLIRVTMAQLDPTRAMLLIVAHQSVFDGFSIGVLGREFGIIADAIETGRPAELHDLPLQYGDFALWQADYQASGSFDADIGFWKSELENARYFELPAEFPRPAVRSTRGASVYRSLPTSFGDRLDAAARAHDLSVFALGVGVISAALHRLTGRKDVTIGTQIAGRDDVDLEPLIGVFINNLVLRLPTDANSTFADQLAIAKSKVQSAVVHQNMPFNRLVEALRPTRDLSRNPLISINFNLQRKTFFQNRVFEGFELLSRPSHAPGTLYDFNMLLIGRPDGWRMTVEYSTDLFSETTANKLLDEAIACFELAFSNPTAAISSSRMVTTATPTASTEPAAAAELARPPADPTRSNVIDVASRTATPKPYGTNATVEIPPSPQQGGVRQRLAGIWSELLGIDSSSCDGDFFALGGHSLLAIRMLARVDAEFGCKPGIGAFLMAPNLRAFASAIETLLQRRDEKVREPERVPAWELIELRNADRKQAVIVTINHPFFYYLLADRFSDNLTISNLRIPNRASIAAQRAMTFEAVCIDAASRIRERYGNRPIVLLGLCVNGRVAINVARHLREAGAQVAGIAMIDSWAPGAFKKLSPAAAFLHKWEVRRRRWTHYIGQRLSGRITTFDLVRKNGLGDALLRRWNLVRPLTEEESLLGEIANHLVDMTRDSIVEPYSGEALLFATQASNARASALMFGWEGVLDDTTPVYPVTGWHEDAISNVGAQKVARIVEGRILGIERVEREGARTTGVGSGYRGNRTSAA
ncbi:MAG: condensation protein [Hyphomicrobiaceae bacterium]|nr:condensation protein [Hyphomicrobiaceae bacterium]